MKAGYLALWVHMVVSDSQGEKLRYTQGLGGATWEVTDHWSSIHKQHTSTHYATAPEISSDFVDLEIKLKLTWEIVPSRPTSSSSIDTSVDV